MMGYYNITPSAMNPSFTALVLSGGFVMLDTNIAAFNAVLSPVLDLSASFLVEVSDTTHEAPNFYS